MLDTVRRWLATLSHAALRVSGAPDYAAYLDHMRDHHPDAPVLSRSAFEREQVTARYTRPGSRCC